MNPASLSRRAEGCLSDFALDEMVAARSLHVEPSPNSAAHLSSCSRCAARLTQFETIDPPAPKAAPLPVKRTATRRLLALSYAVLGCVLFCGALSVFVSPHLEATDTAPATSVDTTVRTKGALALIVIVRDSAHNVRRLTPTDVVHPGESLRFEVTAAQSGYAGVIGIDSAGVAAVYAPTRGWLAAVVGGEPLVLPGAIDMDQTLGTERLVAVRCAEQYSVSDLKKEAERALLAEGGDPTRVGHLELPCTQVVLDLRKEAP